ncbi:MAG: hypothetical protein Q8K60_09385, partial [Parachlamydiaceae bacterium]|nr:hypothetical protein [Parachlamydiaceae bacterium]
MMWSIASQQNFSIYTIDNHSKKQTKNICSNFNDSPPLLLTDADLCYEALKKAKVYNEDGSEKEKMSGMPFFSISSDEENFQFFFNQIHSDLNRIIFTINPPKGSLITLKNLLIDLNRSYAFYDIYYLPSDHPNFFNNLLKKTVLSLFEDNDTYNCHLILDENENSDFKKHSDSINNENQFSEFSLLNFFEKNFHQEKTIPFIKTLFISCETIDEKLKSTLKKIFDSSSISQINHPVHSLLSLQITTQDENPLQLVFHHKSISMIDHEFMNISILETVSQSNSENISFLIRSNENSTFKRACLQYITKTWQPSSQSTLQDNWIAFLFSGKRGARLLSDPYEKYMVESLPNNSLSLHALLINRLSNICISPEDRFSFIFRACLSLNKYLHCHDNEFTQLWSKLDSIDCFPINKFHPSFHVKEALIEKKIPFSLIEAYLTILTFLFYPESLTLHENEYVLGIHFPFPAYLPCHLNQSIKKLLSTTQEDHVPVFKTLFRQFSLFNHSPNLYSHLSVHLDSLNIHPQELTDLFQESLASPYPFLGFIITQ